MRQLFKMKCNQTVKYSNKPWKLIFVHEALESVCVYALCYCDQSELLFTFYVIFYGSCDTENEIEMKNEYLLHVYFYKSN